MRRDPRSPSTTAPSLDSGGNRNPPPDEPGIGGGKRNPPPDLTSENNATLDGGGGGDRNPPPDQEGGGDRNPPPALAADRDPATRDTSFGPVRQFAAGAFLTIMLLGAIPAPVAPTGHGSDQATAEHALHYEGDGHDHDAHEVPVLLPGSDRLEYEPIRAQVQNDNGFLDWLFRLIFGDEECQDCQLDVSECKCMCYSGGYDEDDPECD